jgi:hypothetical protein
MRQLRPPPVRFGGGSKKLHAKAAAEKQQSITLVNQSFDERKIVVLRSDASDKTAKQSEVGYPRVDTIFMNTSAFLGTNPADEPITSGLPVIRQKNSIGVIAQGFRRAYNRAHHGNS